MTLTPTIDDFDAQPMRDRVVLITGGAQGIGRGIAQSVLGAGGSVLIGDLEADAGRACLDEWNVGQRAAFRRLDVSSESSVKGWIGKALKTFGRIDGLVNNAGIADPDIGSFAELSLARWNQYLATTSPAPSCAAGMRWHPCRKVTVRSCISPPPARCSPNRIPRHTPQPKAVWSR
jgi:nucleoside-diphosphate-sugar epimerase